MRIALAQLNPTIGALDENLARIKEYYRRAVAEKADLVVFTELALIGYPPRDLLTYQHFLDKERKLITDDLVPLTAKSGIPIIIGANHQQNNRLYNAALVLEKGEIKSIHLKTLLPFFDVFDEERHFTRYFDRKIEILDHLPTALTICEDIWNDNDYFSIPIYDSDPLEKLFDQGAKLLLNLSASPYHLGKHALREDMLPFLAKKYNTAVIYLNQVGANDELIFDGSSLVYNTRGELLYRSSAVEEELFYVDTEELFKPAAKIVPSDRDDISTVHQLLKLGTRDFLKKTGFKKAALGLSGGIDSSVVAAIAAEALGPENVLGVLMPSPYSSEHSKKDAVTLAENLGIKYRTIAIEQPYYAFTGILNEEGTPILDLAEENLQARLRGNIMMHIANREKYMVLAAGNKSELAVSYCTLYGDMAGGFAMISDIPKMKVYELAHYINEIKGEKVIPESILTKPPSAELRPDQKDEDSLPPYDLLDPILKMYLEETRSPEEIIAEGYDRKTVERVVHMVDTSEFKRKQAAPGLRFTPNSFGRGRRMPIARGYQHW
ncbi:MAG: NAD+ synthase [Bacillota bacterium]